MKLFKVEMDHPRGVALVAASNFAEAMDVILSDKHMDSFAMHVLHSISENEPPLEFERDEDGDFIYGVIEELEVTGAPMAIHYEYYY